MLFAFVMLWAYVSFSQYLIIWSGNLPEEIPWYLARFRGGWGAIGFVILFWPLPAALPAAALAPSQPQSRACSSRPQASSSPCGSWTSLWLILPSFSPAHFSLHWMDLAAVPIGLGGLWVAVFAWQLEETAAPAGRRPGIRGGARAWTRHKHGRPAWPRSRITSRAGLIIRFGGDPDRGVDRRSRRRLAVFQRLERSTEKKDAVPSPRRGRASRTACRRCPASRSIPSSTGSDFQEESRAAVELRLGGPPAGRRARPDRARDGADRRARCRAAAAAPMAMPAAVTTPAPAPNGRRRSEGQAPAPSSRGRSPEDPAQPSRSASKGSLATLGMTQGARDEGLRISRGCVRLRPSALVASGLLAQTIGPPPAGLRATRSRGS